MILAIFKRVDWDVILHREDNLQKIYATKFSR